MCTKLSIVVPLENMLFGFLLFYERKMVDYLLCSCSSLFFDLFELKMVFVSC